MTHKPFRISGLIILVVMLVSFPSHAQQMMRHFDNGLQVGASINYGGIHFESGAAPWSGRLKESVGMQLHATYGQNIFTFLSVNTGVSLFVNRYAFDTQSTPADDGTESEIHTFMDWSVGTAYVGVPLNIVLRPLELRSFYAVIGPEVSFKIDHTNGTIETIVENYSREPNEVLEEVLYDTPERSEDRIWFINAALGYSFSWIPWNIELGLKQGITPYRSGEGIVTSRIRSAFLTAAYRF